MVAGDDTGPLGLVRVQRRVRLGPSADANIFSSSRKLRKKGWRHLRGEFFEQAQRPRHVPVAEMNDREVEGAEAPLRHDLDEPTVADVLGLHHRGKVTDSAARQQCGRKAGVVVHREVGVKRQRFLVLSIYMSKAPASLGLPMRKREQSVIEQILGRLGRLAGL